MTPHLLRTRPLPHWRTAALLAAALGALTGAQAHGTDEPKPAPASVSLNAPPNNYAQPETWLCRPGRKDACAVDLTANLVALPNKGVRQTATRPAKPAVDCFYVYPTISADATGNADMSPGDEEQRVAESQFARFSTLCRPFAPLYRQITLCGMRSRSTGGDMPIDELLPYSDVREAWAHYLKHDNQGRPVVLIGHSQGAHLLTALLANEIEGKPVHKRLVSALLIGSNFEVPRGKDVGASLKATPLCRQPGQTGCVIAFVSFREMKGLPDTARFGASTESTEVACTNPAALAGGKGELRSYFITRAGRMAEFVASAGLAPDDAPYLGLKSWAQAECITTPEASYLSIHQGDDARALRIDLPGDVRVGHRVLPDWGLHIAELNLTMGNLIEVVGQQVRAFTKKGH